MTYHRSRTNAVPNSLPTYVGTSSMTKSFSCSFTDNLVDYHVPRAQALYETCSDYVNPGPPYREGHDFYLCRKTVEYMDSESVDIQAYIYRYVGSFAVGVTADLIVDNAYNGYAQTAGTYGAQAINKMRPVQPRMGLGQALGEMRDFPSLFKVQLRRFKDLGSGYLNYKFGWKPFIKDVLDFINFQKKLEKHVAFIRKNNNKWLRRRCTIRDDSQVTTSAYGCICTPIPVSYLLEPIGKAPVTTRTIITKDRIWAKGKMKFYIPGLKVDKAESVWTSPLLRKLSGLEITPSLLWELTPWTWLTDWFVNMGDLYSNISNQMYDNLVTKYAYVMRHRQTRAVYNTTVWTRTQLPRCTAGQITGWQAVQRGPVLTPTAVCMAECKERSQAAWWGIGNTAGGPISDSQLQILLALGLQKA